MSFVIRLSGTPTGSSGLTLQDRECELLGPFKNRELAETWLNQNGFKNEKWGDSMFDWWSPEDLIIKIGRDEFKVHRLRAVIKRLNRPKKIGVRRPEFDEILHFRSKR